MELRPYRKRVYGDGHYSHTVYSCFCDIYIATLSDYRVRCIRLPCQEPCNIGIARGIFLFLFFFSEKNVFLLFNIVWPFLTMKSGMTSSIFAQTNLGLEKVQSKVIYYTRIWNGIQRIDIASPQSTAKLKKCRKESIFYSRSSSIP